jgi:hypothetical protein
MKALIVAERDEIASIAQRMLRAVGFDSMRYRNPLKAMDNLEEIEPDLVAMSALDYPRHWKTLLQCLRSFFERERCVFVLLTPYGFPMEEAAKASHLGANGIVCEDLELPENAMRFSALLKRYKPVEEKREGVRLVPQESDGIALFLIHPSRYALIPGKVTTISAKGLSFHADDPLLVADLALGTEARGARLKVGGRILSVDLRVVAAGRIINFRITGIQPDDADYLERYLSESAERIVHSITLS